MERKKIVRERKKEKPKKIIVALFILFSSISYFLFYLFLPGILGYDKPSLWAFPIIAFLFVMALSFILYSLIKLTRFILTFISNRNKKRPN